MTYLNPICADVGTRNCPCPLAETGDCLVCSRLSGRGACDCRWAGVCVYNEYIQNGSKVRGRREDRNTRILQRLWRGDDLVLLQLDVPRGFALEASRPGSFLFLKAPGASELTNVPVSVMAADAEHKSIWIALRILSAKTKALAACEDVLDVRGVYRSGLLGRGLAGMQEDGKTPGGKNPAGFPGREQPAEKSLTENNTTKAFEGEYPALKRWLILTRGAGFAPAVNLLRWISGRVSVHVISDPEKVGEDVIREQFRAWQPEAHMDGSGRPEPEGMEAGSARKSQETPAGGACGHVDAAGAEDDRFRLEFQSLAKLLDRLEAASPLQQTDPHAADSTAPAPQIPDSTAPAPHPPAPHASDLRETDYDRIFILASDYYIKRLSAAMEIPPEKLVFCNNFHLCCGEGICGACGHVDAAGNLRRMCKCREFFASDLLLPEI